MAKMAFSPMALQQFPMADLVFLLAFVGAFTFHRQTRTDPAVVILSCLSTSCLMRGIFLMTLPLFLSLSAVDCLQHPHWAHSINLIKWQNLPTIRNEFLWGTRLQSPYIILPPKVIFAVTRRPHFFLNVRAWPCCQNFFLRQGSETDFGPATYTLAILVCSTKTK